MDKTPESDPSNNNNGDTPEEEGFDVINRSDADDVTDDVDSAMKESKLDRHSASRVSFTGNIRRMMKRKSSADSTHKDAPPEITRIEPGISEDTNSAPLISHSDTTEVASAAKDKAILTKQDYVHDDDDVISARSHEVTTRSDNEISRDAENDEGINDSITNLSLFTSFLYTVVSRVSRYAWVFLRSTVRFVVDALSGGGEQRAPVRDGAADASVTDNVADKPQVPVDDVDDATARRLYNIANELMTTEEQYVKRLGVLVILKTQTSSMLHADVAKAMFQNIEVIHQFHHDNLLPELHQRIENWDTIRKIGDIMKKLTPFLKLYTEYVKNYESANNLLLSWRQKNSAFDKLMRDAEANASYGRLKVQAHMLEPIQRVPRYELLLRDYLRKLPANSPDRDDSQKAMTLVAEAASHFEDMMERDSRLLELIQLQSQFDGAVNIVHPSREFIHKGKIRAISTKTAKISDKIIHMFNDMLLVSSDTWSITSGDHYKTKYHFSFSHTKIGYGLNLEVNHVFYLSSQGKVVELVASDMDERLDWMTRIDKHIQACADKNNTTHTYIPERNYSYEQQWCKRKQILQLSLDGGKTWKKRTLTIYDNGLMTCFKSHSDKQPMSVVHLGDYHIALGSIPHRKGKVCTLVGEGKTYHLHDDNVTLVERFYDDASPFQMSNEEDLTSQQFASTNQSIPADAVSIDSGLEVQNVRLSGASTDSNASWSRVSTVSLDSDVNSEYDVTKDSGLLGDTPGQRFSGLSTDSGFTEAIKEELNVEDEQGSNQNSTVTLDTRRKSSATEGTEC